MSEHQELMARLDKMIEQNEKIIEGLSSLWQELNEHHLWEREMSNYTRNVRVVS